MQCWVQPFIKATVHACEPRTPLADSAHAPVARATVARLQQAGSNRGSVMHATVLQRKWCIHPAPHTWTWEAAHGYMSDGEAEKLGSRGFG
jgi:hypothetical protein